MEIDPLKEREAYEWLKFRLPRKSKVNLQPKGSEKGVLIANLISLDSNENISNSMIDLGLAKNNCDS